MVTERNVARLAAVQHLRTAHGIKTKNWNKNKASGCKLTANAEHSGKVFGVPLESLPQCCVECGSVPSFLVDACTSLREHVDTEGLFRKSGSIVRLKALRTRLDAGERCLSTALPCDVAGLVKQFFRELPEPVLPAELQEAFLKAQQLPTTVERTSATLLLSCVLPDRNLSVLRYFLSFLHDVSQRSAANKMDSSNLSVILAPNLLHSGDGTEKMNAGTEKRLKLQAAVVHSLIENTQAFGVVPEFLLERVPAMLGCEAAALSPSQEGLEEVDANSGMKKRRRRSFGVFSSSAATPVIMTPGSKRKLPSESGQSHGFSSKKRRSIKKNLGIDLLPNTLFGGSSTPGPGFVDPSGSGLDSSQNTLASAGDASRHAVRSNRRKSRRLSNRHAVSRVESGKAGCFSPKVSKKETVRKSLRLRFSLGKSSSESGSESIGWRLATQESTTKFTFTKDLEFSPGVRRSKAASKGSKFISKSEDNLLTPQCDLSAHRTSWSGETPDGDLGFSGGSFTDTPMNMCRKNNNYYSSEPAIVTAKPPIPTSLPKKLCCASSAQSLEAEGSFSEAPRCPTLLKIKKAVAEPGGDPKASDAPYRETRPLANVVGSPGSMPPPPLPYTPQVVLLNNEDFTFPTPQRCLADDQNITFGQMEIVSLSPLHIDSALFEVGSYETPREKAGERSVCARAGLDNSVLEDRPENLNCSRLIDALDIQSPAHFQLGVSAEVQSTPYRASGLGSSDDLCTPLPSRPAPPVREQEEEEDEEENLASPERAARAQKQEEETRRLRVAEHIKRFNTLTLHSPKAHAKTTRPQLQFQRTPVRQSVRRINSLVGDKRPAKTEAASSQAGPVVKAVSLESGLASGPQLQPCLGQPGTANVQDKARSVKIRPPVPPKKPSTMARRPKMGALGDVTNQVQPRVSTPTPTPTSKTGAQKTAVQQVAERDASRYRGSPRNPLSEVRLLSATKPIDL